MNYRLYILPIAIATALIIMPNDKSWASDTDDGIRSAAKQSFVFKHYLQDDDITVTANNGVVTLIGTVSDESKKVLAKETVAGLPGVKSVDNQLTLRGKVPDSYSDAWLLTKVKWTLLFHRNVDGTGTKVFVTDGLVTLHGETTSEAQKDLTTEYAMDVDGVKSVRNEMTVKVAQIPTDKQPTDTKRIGEKTMGQQLDVMSEAIDDASTSALVKTTLILHRSTSGLYTTADTKDGVVTLGGKALNDAEKDLATKLVSDVHGVKRVVNNMTVVAETKTDNPNTAGEYLDDAVITSKIKAEIVNDPLLKVLQINVQSTNGVVQLGGIVDSTAAASRAGEVASAVKGVKSVTNNLTVK